MFWNITAANWALLWSAVIGAIIAGGSAAAVALWVLNRTREDQEALAKTQLEEQRKDLEHQLREQSAALDKQLAEQRLEAFRVRERAAIAEMIVAAEDFNEAYRQGIEAIAEVYLRLSTVMRRWELEHVYMNYSSGTRWWATELNGLAYQAFTNSRTDKSPAAGEELRTATTEFAVQWALFASGSLDSRRTFMKRLFARGESHKPPVDEQDSAAGSSNPPRA